MRGEESFPESGTLPLIPLIRSLDICRGGGADQQWHHGAHARIRRRISSQGMPRGPSRSKASRRRSNSSRWAPVTGIASGVRERLSQSSSRSCSRSSKLRSAMSILAVRSVYRIHAPKCGTGKRSTAYFFRPSTSRRLPRLSSPTNRFANAFVPSRAQSRGGISVRANF